MFLVEKEKSQNTSLWPPGNTSGEGKRMKGRGRKDLLIQGFRVVATILWPYDGLMEDSRVSWVKFEAISYKVQASLH